MCARKRGQSQERRTSPHALRSSASGRPPRRIRRERGLQQRAQKTATLAYMNTGQHNEQLGPATGAQALNTKVLRNNTSSMLSDGVESIRSIVPRESTSSAPDAFCDPPPSVLCHHLGGERDHVKHSPGIEPVYQNVAPPVPRHQGRLHGSGGGVSVKLARCKRTSGGNGFW